MNDLENHLLNSPMHDDSPCDDTHNGLIHCDICGDPLYTGDIYYVLPYYWTQDGKKRVCEYCMDVHRYEV